VYKLLIGILPVVFWSSTVLPSSAQNPFFIEQELVSPIKAEHPLPIEDVGIVDRSLGIYERFTLKYVIEASDRDDKIPNFYWSIHHANNTGDASHRTHSQREFSHYVSRFSGGLKSSLSDGRLRAAGYCYHGFDSKRREILWFLWKVGQVNTQPSSLLAHDHIVLASQRIRLNTNNEQGEESQQTCEDSPSGSYPQWKYVGMSDDAAIWLWHRALIGLFLWCAFCFCFANLMFGSWVHYRTEFIDRYWR
jgi:hypothetical protein